MNRRKNWPALLVLAYTTGILSSEYCKLTLLAWVWGLASLACLRPRYAAGCLTLALLAVLSFTQVEWLGNRRLADPLREMDGLRLIGVGEVAATARRGYNSNATLLQLEHIEGRPEIPATRIWLVFHSRQQAPDLQIGERWRVRGHLAAPRGPAFPGAFDSRKLLARQGVFHELVVWDDGERLQPPQSWLFALRLTLMDRLGALFPKTEGGLLTGIVLGETQSLPPLQADQFRQTGTGHLLAASGANVALVTGVFLWLGARLGFGPYRLAFPALALIWGYAGLAGLAPSIVRASAMATLVFLAKGLGRRSDLSRSLSFGVLACLVWDPYMLFDVAFQLSAGAVLTLALLTPVVAAYLPAHRLRPALAMGIAVQVGLLPLCLWHFQSYSPLSILANLWVAPPVELLLPLGLLVAALPVAPLVWVCLQLLRFVLWSQAFLCLWITQVYTLLPTPAEMIAYWLAVAALGLLWASRWRTGLAAAALAVALLWTPEPEPVPGEFHLHSCQLRGAPALWLVTPSAHHWLILSQSEQLPRAMAMLRLQRIARPHAVIFAPSAGQLRSPEGLVWEGTPERWTLDYRNVHCKGGKTPLVLPPQVGDQPRVGQEELEANPEAYEWISDGLKLEMRNWLDETVRTPIRHRLGRQTGQPAPDRSLVPRPPAAPGLSGGAAGDVLPGLHPDDPGPGRRTRRGNGKVHRHAEQPL